MDGVSYKTLVPTSWKVKEKGKNNTHKIMNIKKFQ